MKGFFMSKTSFESFRDNLLDKLFDAKEDDFLFIVARKKIRSNRWFMGFQDSFIEIAKDKNLRGQDRQVILYLLGSLNFENHLQITQKSIAKDLDIPRVNVTKSIKKLNDCGYIDLQKVDGRNEYRINPEFVWKGKVVNRDEALKAKD